MEIFHSLNRHEVVNNWLRRIEESGGVENFSQGHKYFGIHIQQDNSVVVREWAPGAKELYLTGDFSKFEYIYCGKLSI